MNDLFDTIVLCKRCNIHTDKIITIKNNFKIRGWKCPKCKDVWLHPADVKEFENFSKIRSKQFSVKLRIVGNSYTISIPKEIIDFYKLDTDEIVNIALDNPEKLSILFSRLTKRFINDDEW